MFSFRSECPRECPVCSARVTDWSTRCPKCRYHPDCDPRPYHRAQDDVAMIARYRPVKSPTVRVQARGAGSDWRRLLPPWLRGPSAA